MITFGADPGISGAVAFFDDKTPDNVYILDVPSLEVHIQGVRKPRKVVSQVELFDNIYAFTQDFRIEYGIFEYVQTHSRDGAVGAFRFGHTTGCMQQALTCAGLTYDEVTPQIWKQHFNLIGCEKRDSILLAREMFPAASKYFKRISMDDGRAEAALMAVFANRKLREEM